MKHLSVSSQPTLCMIFENIAGVNAIGKVAMSGIHAALEAGWRVSVVAKTLETSLQSEVEWLPLAVPNRLYLLQWLTARRFMEQALGRRTFDVVHAHQPQAASLSDVFQCHFLTRVALERSGLKHGQGARAVCNEVQHKAALYAEDYYYRHWNPRTRMLYDSDLTRRDFHCAYGPLPHEEVLVYAFPPLRLVSQEEKRRAQVQLLGHIPARPVLGYLGGINERKGYRKLLRALQSSPDVFLLMGGQHTENYEVPALTGRFHAAGIVRDVDTFYTACDAFIVPSDYEPLGLVAFEAAARGVPVIATEAVGALPHLQEYGVGVTWHPDQPLEPLVHHLVEQRAVMADGARRMAADLGQESYSKRLLAVYHEILGDDKRTQESSF